MDYTMDDDDIDMPYAPPLQQATAPRCPYNQASRNSIHAPNTRYPALMNPWAGYHGGYVPPSMYGTPNMPPVPYSGATPGYATQYTQWSQTTQVQNTMYPNFQDPQHQNQPPPNRPFPTLPPPVSVPPDYSWSAPWPNNPRARSSFAEEPAEADTINDNINHQGMDYMGNSGAGPSREPGKLPLRMSHYTI